jgi:hypothetical protein
MTDATTVTSSGDNCIVRFAFETMIASARKFARPRETLFFVTPSDNPQ